MNPTRPTYEDQSREQQRRNVGAALKASFEDLIQGTDEACGGGGGGHVNVGVYLESWPL